MVFLIKISDKGRVFMTINERIRKLRRHLDLTQKEFAAQIGTTQNSLTGFTMFQMSFKTGVYLLKRNIRNIKKYF